MKKITTLIIVIFVSILVQMIGFLPWWSFIVPIFFLGVLLPLERWQISAFPFGFLAGFLAWFLSTLYFEANYKGEIMDKISKIISIPNYLIYIVVGFIGGLLMSLSFYSGFLLRKGKEILKLELPEN